MMIIVEQCMQIESGETRTSRFFSYQALMHVFMQIVVYLNIKNIAFMGNARWNLLTIALALVSGTGALVFLLMSYRELPGELRGIHRVLMVLYTVTSLFTEYFVVISVMNEFRILSNGIVIFGTFYSFYAIGTLVPIAGAGIYGLLLIGFSFLFEQKKRALLIVIGFLFIIATFITFPLMVSSGVSAVIFIVVHLTSRRVPLAPPLSVALYPETE